jgi:hypothetical protein
MSKAECNRAYLRQKHAKEMAHHVPKVSHVSEVFKRRPYSASNYTPGDHSKEEPDGDV